MLHPLYQELYRENEIALVKLSTKVTFSNTIRPVYLPNGKSSLPGTKAVITEWVSLTKIFK